MRHRVLILLPSMNADGYDDEENAVTAPGFRLSIYQMDSKSSGYPGFQLNPHKRLLRLSASPNKALLAA